MSELTQYEKQVDRHEQEISRINHALTELVINSNTLTVKQSLLIDKLDGYISRDENREERLLKLENAIRDNKNFRNNLTKLLPAMLLFILVVFMLGAAFGETNFGKNLISLLIRY